MTGASIANDGGYTDLKLPNYMAVPESSADEEHGNEGQSEG